MVDVEHVLGVVLRLDLAQPLIVGPVGRLDAVLALFHQRLGKPLLGELEGLDSARRGDYRRICEIHEEQMVVLIHRVQHRRDVYGPR